MPVRGAGEFAKNAEWEKLGLFGPFELEDFHGNVREMREIERDAGFSKRPRSLL